MDAITSNFGCISWIVFGGIAGWVAALITGNSGRQGCLTNIIIGILGAVIGGWGYAFITGGPLNIGWNLTAFVVAILGSVGLLAVLSLVFRRS